MLKMEGLIKVFHTDTVETHALKGFHLHVGKGEFVTVMGPSGSGKSTFLNIAGLLDTFDSGSYILDGEDVSGLNDKRRSNIRNHKIGFIFQEFNLIQDMSLYGNVDLPLRYRGLSKPERHQRILKALKTVGLDSRKNHLPSQLSGGQQQRVAIARAISGSPQLILADEPTGNLDTTMAAAIMDLLGQINADGATIVMVSHDPELARRTLRQIHILDGKVAHDQ